MSSIKRLSTQSGQFNTQLRTLLAFDASQDDAIEQAAADILHQVQAHGDTALLDYTRRFDKVSAGSVAELEIPRTDWLAALNSLPAEQRAALEAAAERVRRYHEHQRAESWSYTEPDGTVLGQKITPLDRVGLYVPGGKAAYPSSVLMNAIPAKVAGVAEVIMVTPTPNGVHNPIVLAAAALGALIASGALAAPRRLPRWPTALKPSAPSTKSSARATPMWLPPSAGYSVPSAST